MLSYPTACHRRNNSFSISFRSCALPLPMLAAVFTSQCDIASSSVPGKGLEVVAREPLPAGCQVLLEPAYAFVVRAAYAQSFCEHCLGRNIGAA